MCLRAHVFPRPLAAAAHVEGPGAPTWGGALPKLIVQRSEGVIPRTLNEGGVVRLLQLAGPIQGYRGCRIPRGPSTGYIRVIPR